MIDAKSWSIRLSPSHYERLSYNKDKQGSLYTTSKFFHAIEGDFILSYLSVVVMGSGVKL